MTAKFRAYASYAESFRDYAQLMKDSPRYAGVVAQAAGTGSAASAQGFAQGLQRAGYATDPAYADKLDPRHQHHAAHAAASPTLTSLQAQPHWASRRCACIVRSARRAMIANYAALQTTGNNIANANTPGYSRQSAELATARASSPARASSARASTSRRSRAPTASS